MYSTIIINYIVKLRIYYEFKLLLNYNINNNTLFK